MPEPTYTITLTESERTALAAALGTFVTKLTNCRVQIEVPQRSHTAALSPSTASPAAAPPAPIEPRDRWARDRKGNEVPNPADAYPADVHIWKTTQFAKYLKVTWQSSSGQGYADANCFDSQLWPWLIASAGSPKRTRLYLAAKGNYHNIVGVRA